MHPVDGGPAGATAAEVWGVRAEFSEFSGFSESLDRVSNSQIAQAIRLIFVLAVGSPDPWLGWHLVVGGEFIF